MDDEDEELQLQRALALSQKKDDDDEDEDADLQRAIALSQSNRLEDAMEVEAPPPPSTPVERVRARVQELFAQFTAAGKSPNEAAAEALKQATAEEEKRNQPAATNDGLPPLEDAAALLDKDGFQARVKALFAAHVAAGMNANEAAASALQQTQGEQLKAAQQARSARAKGGDGDGGAGGAGKAAPAADDAPDEDAEALARQLSGQEAVEAFERWEEIERVATAQVDTILELFRTDGVKFVDPSFAPTDRALYLNTESATTWKCRACGKRNPLPPAPDARRLISLMSADSAREVIQCAHCRSESSMLEVAFRPTAWGRPNELVDDVTLQRADGVPWVIFRDDPRPEDIRQGLLGNCWFVCAMSCLSSHLRRVVVTQAHNHAGVYQIKLCRAGEWHCVVIDDIFPIDPLSRLTYLKAARRQLYAPLVEKAAAKLHGSYEALNGGTFAEAFGMLTGMPVQVIRLGRYKPPKDPPPSASAAERASYERHLAKWKKEGYDLDELFAKLLSFLAAGFVIGCSTFLQTEKEINEARATGIQVPHAYGLLECAECDGEALVKLRNPNGHAGWKGAWSRGSAEWTYERKQELGIEQEDQGVFWMSWDDFCVWFAEVCICRLLPEHLDARQGGWLPSVYGAGQALEVEVFAHTQLELTLHQEMHSNRGENAMLVNLDLGVAVLQLGAPGGVTTTAGGGGAAEDSLALVARGERSPSSSISIDTTLPCDGYTSRYLILPLCFGLLQSPEPRKFVAAALATQPLSISPVTLPPARLGHAVIEIARAHGEKQTLIPPADKLAMFGEMLNIYQLQEDGGWSIVAENNSPYQLRVELDASHHTSGFLSSRNALFCEDVLPPHSRQLLMVLSVDVSKRSHSLSMSFGGGVLQPGEFVPAGAGHIPALDALGSLAPLHEPIKIGNSAGMGMAAAPPPAGSVDVAALAGNILRSMSQK